VPSPELIKSFEAQTMQAKRIFSHKVNGQNSETHASKAPPNQETYQVKELVMRKQTPAALLAVDPFGSSEKFRLATLVFCGGLIQSQ